MTDLGGDRHRPEQRSEQGIDTRTQPTTFSCPSALERIERTSHGAIGELRAILGVLREDGRDAGHAEPPSSPAPGIGNIGELVDRARESGLEMRRETDRA
jgi:hypothetical protein